MARSWTPIRDPVGRLDSVGRHLAGNHRLDTSAFSTVRVENFRTLDHAVMWVGCGCRLRGRRKNVLARPLRAGTIVGLVFRGVDSGPIRRRDQSCRARTEPSSRSMSSLKAASSSRRRLMARMACMTVVWSRPPK